MCARDTRESTYNVQCIPSSYKSRQEGIVIMYSSRFHIHYLVHINLFSSNIYYCSMYMCVAVSSRRVPATSPPTVWWWRVREEGRGVEEEE